MDANEREIYYYVKSQQPNSARARDIGRRVGGRRRFHYNPDWATPVLLRMLERGILETDADGSYRLKPAPPYQNHGKHWVAPEIARVLRASGKAFAVLRSDEDEDEYYDNL